MGEVWTAQHSMLARKVAIKLIRAEALQGAYSREIRSIKLRFERDAQAIASLNSPHTVALNDFGASEEESIFTSWYATSDPSPPPAWSTS